MAVLFGGDEEGVLGKPPPPIADRCGVQTGRGSEGETGER